MATGSRMPIARLTLLATILVVLVGVAGCDAAATTSGTLAQQSGRHLPTWQLQWDLAHAQSSGHVSAQMAFAAAAMVLHQPDGTKSAPVATVWLATGPRFGIAVVRLDPADTYQDAVMLTTDPANGVWNMSLDTGLPTPCAQGTATMIGSLALGDTCGVGLAESVQVPAFTLRYWLTPTSNRYFAERINATALRPTTGATTLSLPPGLGWSAQQGDYTCVVLPLPHGQTFLLAGTAEATQIQQLAAQVSTQLDTIVPLASNLPTLPVTP